MFFFPLNKIELETCLNRELPSWEVAKIQFSILAEVRVSTSDNVRENMTFSN